MTTGIWTVPNLLSLLRLIGVPYFLWLIIDQANFKLAIVVLLASGATDWLDGYAARKLNQQTRLGELLDPLVDRLYIGAAVLALVIKQELSVVVLVVLLSRDFLMAILLSAMKRKGYTGFPVHFIGKAATMNLLWAFPLILLGTFDSNIGRISHLIASAFLIWGLALYWYAGILYWRQYLKLEVAKTG